MTITDDEREELSRANHKGAADHCEVCFLHRRLDESRLELSKMLLGFCLIHMGYHRNSICEHGFGSAPTQPIETEGKK